MFFSVHVPILISFFLSILALCISRYFKPFLFRACIFFFFLTPMFFHKASKPNSKLFSLIFLFFLFPFFVFSGAMKNSNLKTMKMPSSITRKAFMLLLLLLLLVLVLLMLLPFILQQMYLPLIKWLR
jgi:hypothetical protein